MEGHRFRRITVRRFLLSTVCLGLVLFQISLAGSRQPPQETGISGGTVQVSGRVLTDDATPAPVRRAVVTLSGDVLLHGLSAITDEHGVFVLTNVPVGRFSLTASKAGFLSVPYGATRLGGLGTSLVVDADQDVSGVQLRLVRGAAVSGVVRDPIGEPAPDVQVALLRRDLQGHWTATSPLMRTNENGAYRAFGREPGEYLVLARPTGAASRPTRIPSTAEIDAALRELQRGSMTSVEPERHSIFAPVLYPGVLAASDASTLTLRPGEELVGIDVALQLVPTAPVEGGVVLPSGLDALSVRLSLVAEDAPGFSPQSLRPETDGTFRFAAVSPGRYELTAQTTDCQARRTGNRTSSTTRGASLWARAELTVTEEGTSEVSMVLSPCLRIQGRVVFDNDPSASPPDMTKLRVAVTPERGRVVTTGLGRTVDIFDSAISEDGTFEIANLLPGEYRLSLDPSSSGVSLQSVLIGDHDVLDGVFVLADDDEVVTAEVTLSDRLTRLMGTLYLSSDVPMLDVVVVVFTTDRNLWGLRSKRVQASRPSTDGVFEFGDVPPGEYFLAALTDIVEEEWRMPGFLGELVPAAVKVSLVKGRTTQQDLRIVGGDALSQ